MAPPSAVVSNVMASGAAGALARARMTSGLAGGSRASANGGQT